jgi:hypothetical protein
MGAGRNLWMIDTSVGGEGLDEVENGRFTNSDGPALLANAQAGRYSLYHMCTGTNDYASITASYTAYGNRWIAVIQQALALHPNVHVMVYTVIPRSIPQTGPDYEANRLLLNQYMRDYAATDARVHISEFGTNATIGDKALQAASDPSTYYIVGYTHFSAAGDVSAASISAAAVTAWRTALGIA